jgi:hypothetical protein
VTMGPRLRKLALTAHVVCSVGWLGAVAAFLALAIAGLASSKQQVVQASYLAMDAVSWFVIVPLSLASPVTGIVQGLGTTWGLFRYYWVIAKLVMTIPATLLFLLVHTHPIGRMATLAAQTTLSQGEHRSLRIQLIADATAAIVVLLATTVLSIYKPAGVTPYGWRKQREEYRSPG